MAAMEKAPAGALWVRLATGLAQGVALYALAESKLEPFTADPWSAAAWMVALFAPAVLLAGAGAMRPISLATWSVIAGAALAGLGAYGAWRVAGVSPAGEAPFQLLFAPLALFIAHHLVQAGLAARSWRAPYPAYFDLAWTHGVRLVLALGFTGAFWALLWLGAALFGLIGVPGFGKLLEQSWFALPASSLAFAAAVHLTAERAALVIGARTLALTLLSWLLPLLVVIAGGFVVTMPFTGLSVLWSSSLTSALLLNAAVCLVLLVNAAFQSGEQAPGTVLKLAVRVASVVLVLLVAGALFSLVVRTDAYGFTQARVVAWAGALMLTVYAVGYVAAAFLPGAWMQRLPFVNVVAAYGGLAILLALMTPLADPAALSARDQMHRLLSGKTAPDTFDYFNVGKRNARFGKDALEHLAVLKGDARKEDIAKRAAEAKTATEADPDLPATAEQVRGAVTVLEGPPLPPEVIADPQDWRVRACATQGGCKALWRDIDTDPAAELLVFTDNGAIVFDREEETDRYAIVGIAYGAGKPSTPGDIKTVRPRFDDLEVNGNRVAVSPE